MMHLITKSTMLSIVLSMIAFLCISAQLDTQKSINTHNLDQQPGRVYYLHEMEVSRSNGRLLLNRLTAFGNVIIVFYADWCRPCQLMASIFENLAVQTDDITFIKVNRDLYRPLFDSYGLSTIPAILFFRNGILVKKQLSSVKKEKMIKIIKQVYA